MTTTEIETLRNEAATAGDLALAECEAVIVARASS